MVIDLETIPGKGKNDYKRKTQQFDKNYGQLCKYHIIFCFRNPFSFSNDVFCPLITFY